MKIITISEIGYNHPSQANWSYGIWKIDTIDTAHSYSMSYIVKETFGGDSRFIQKVKDECKKDIFITKGCSDNKITGVSNMLDIESKELLQIIKNFLTSK